MKISEKAKSKLWVTAALALICVFVFLIYAFFAWFSGLFSGANDSVKAASITAFGSVVVFVVGRYLEQSRERKARLNGEKITVYKKFMDLYFDLMDYPKIHGSPKPNEEILQEMLDFQRELVFWGSDSVLKSYLNFKDSMTNSQTLMSIGIDADTELGLAKMIQSVAQLMTAMRKDIGYTFTSFSGYDLARLQLADDEQTMRVKRLLKTNPKF